MSNAIYYVYAYLREDGTPYYIGKGKGRRAWARHNVSIPPDKDRIVMLHENMSEEQALSREIELIAHYGRKDTGTGILRNLTPGGEVTPDWNGKKHKESTKKKMSDLRTGKTYEDLWGIEIAEREKAKRATRMAEYNKSTTGKSLEEIIGEDKAKERRERYKTLFSGENNPMYGVEVSKEQRERKRKEKLAMPKKTCEHCGKTVDEMNFARWHGDKCKMKDKRDD